MIQKNMPDYEWISSKADSFSNITLMCVVQRWSEGWKNMITSQTNEAIYNKEILHACTTLFM